MPLDSVLYLGARQSYIHFRVLARARRAVEIVHVSALK